MKKYSLLLASAALTVTLAGAAGAAETVITTTTPVTTTTTKSTTSESIPLGNVTNTTISSQTTGEALVKKTVTAVDPVADTISTTTTTTAAPVTTRSEMNVETREQAVIDGKTRIFNLKEFDLNNDGILSTSEVGEKLFKMYDTDGNGVIDNIEYERPSVITVVPVEKTTTVTYDFNGDGIAEQQEQTYESFLRYTQLARFDADKDGLSPREFVGRGYLEADIDGDKFVDMKEWQASYNASIDRSLKIKGNLNK